MVKSIQVLMATYNGEKFLPQQLVSLQAQDDGCFSVLMQDDGSTDTTPAILEEIVRTDSRFGMAACNGRHMGAIGNFISLMRQCTADYAALCDQDDIWAPNRLSRCREMLEKAEQELGENTPLLVHSDSRLIDGNGDTLQESFYLHQGWDKDAVTLKRLLVQNNVTGCTVMMNAALRRLVAEHGDPSIIQMHDWFSALTAASFGRVLYLDEPLVYYRQHGTNVVGASRTTLFQRGLKALSQWEKGKQRIAMTYAYARVFRDCYPGILPHQARETIADYLEIQSMNKLDRVISVWKKGYLMQSRTTRLGHLFFL